MLDLFSYVTEANGNSQTITMWKLKWSFVFTITFICTMYLRMIYSNHYIRT